MGKKNNRTFLITVRSVSSNLCTPIPCVLQFLCELGLQSSFGHCTDDSVDPLACEHTGESERQGGERERERRRDGAREREREREKEIKV